MTPSSAVQTPSAVLRWSFPVTARIALAIVLLVCSALLLSGLLNFAKFEKTLNTLADGHYAFLLGDVEDSVEAEVAIGVPLSSLHNIQDLIERERRMEPAVTAIQVADNFGRILYSTTPEAVGKPAPTSWPLDAKPNAVWRATTDDGVTLGEPIVNAFDGIVGTLAVTYSSAYYQEKDRQVLDVLLRQALPLALGGTVVTLVGCLILLRSFRRSMGTMARDLEALLAGRSVDLDRTKTGNVLEQQFTAFLRLLAQASSGGGLSPRQTEGTEGQQNRKLLYPTFILAAFVILTPLGVVSWQAVGAFEKVLVPEMLAKGAALARAVTKDVTRALDLQIPIGKLGGTEAYLDGMLKLAPEATYIAIADDQGRLLYSGGMSVGEVRHILRKGHPLPTGPDADYGLVETADNIDITIAVPSPDPNSFGRAFVHVGISRKSIIEQSRDIMFNVGVMSLAGLLITFEVLLLVIALVILHPLNLLQRLLALVNQGDLSVDIRSIGRNEVGRLVQLIETGIGRLRAVAAPVAGHVPKELRAANLVFMRTPLFLFCFAEEFARSFFPIYTNGLAANIHGVSSTMLASLPITIFMLMVAVLTPISAVWSDRRGRRPLFLLGAGLSTLGMVLTGLADSYWALLAYRALSGIGYSIVFMASQGYVLDNTSERDRSRGMASYVAAITAADVAGPPIGGIFSDQIGFQASFLVAACFIVLAAVIAWLFMRDDDNVKRMERRRMRLSDVGLLLRNPRFTGLIVCVSMPSKLLLAGFLFYLVPLHLAAIGQTEAAIGRIIMIYAVSCIAFTPIAAHIADKWRMQQIAVIGGAIIAGLSLTVLLIENGMLGIVIAVAGLGIGQAFTLAAQLSLVTRYAADEAEWLGRTTVVSVFRLVERLGAAIGPLIAGGLFVSLGARDAIVILGAAAAASALILIGILCFAPREEG
jgi:predicted MFS family arabinose efflux permease